MFVSLRKFTATLREAGVVFTAWQVLKKVPAEVVYLRSCYLMRTDLELYADKEEDSDPLVRWATQDEVNAIAAILWDAARIREHMREGSRVVVLEDADGVQACSWFRFGVAELDHWLRLVMPDDGVYSMYTFVAREHRGRGHFGRLVRFGNRCMAQQGFRHVFNIVDRSNRNSWRAREKSGGYRVGTIFAIGVLGWLAVRAGDSWHFGHWTPGRRLQLNSNLSGVPGP